MKYSIKKYAQALADAIAEKNVDEKKLMRNFLALLENTQDMKKADQILLLAEKLLLKKTGNKKVVLETARKTDIKNIMASFTKKGDVVERKINPGLVAGLKVIVDGNRQLDFSLQKKLQEMFR